MQLELEKLKKFLVETGLVTRKEVDALDKKAGGQIRPFKELVLEQAKVSADDFRQIESYLLGIPYIDLKSEKVHPDVLKLIPEPIARSHNIVAFRRTDKTLEVAMLDPTDLQAIEFVGKGAGLKILPRLADAASIKNVLAQYQKSLKVEFGDLIKKATQTLGVGQRPTTKGEELKKLTEGLPVIRMIEVLLHHAVLQRASDVHLETYEKELVVRYRVDGILQDAMILPQTAAPELVARIKVLANLRLDERRLPQDGRFKIDEGGNRVSLRVSVLPTYYGEKVVLRLLPETDHGLPLEASGFHGPGLEIVRKASRQANGLILVTGPTGSGKSTTLYSLLELLNTPDVNICTVEDPIEYQIPRINQTQVKPEIGLTFANGLRALLRQDPDIIMVGEIRDRETAALAINAALTGHLVLSTLHTNSAAGAVPRLLDMGVEPFLLTSTLSVVIGQRLVRRLCGRGEAYVPTPAALSTVGENVDWQKVLANLQAEKVLPAGARWETTQFYHPQITEDCPDGYRGRIGIAEVFAMSPSIKQLVVNGKTAGEIEKQARGEGMLTMLEDGIFKAAQGLTTIEEVLRVTTTE